MNRLFLSCLLGVGIALAQTPAAPKTAAPKVTTPAKPAAPAVVKPAAPAATKPMAPKPVVAAKPKPVVPVKPPAPPEPDRDPGLYADFEIVQGADNLGHIIIKFYESEMPITVHNFVDLARGMKLFADPKTGRRVKRPLYNGLVFHRVIPEFMIQGGDPQGTGFGGTDAIQDEFHPSLAFDKPYLLAMANAGPGTGSSQFFITTKTQRLPSYLNGKHPIFGIVVEGQDVAEKVVNVATGEANKPIVPVVMKTVTIKRYPKGAPIWPVAPAAAKPVVPVAKPKPAMAPPAKKL
jgi:peptidyl-prolyl cis-trans isomerase A (cyclophilin A)